MFKRITVAYNETPEAERALLSAIQLAKILSAELRTITVMANLPAYTAFAAAGDPSLPQTLEDDRLKFYQGLQEKARVLAESQGVEVLSHIVDGLQVAQPGKPVKPRLVAAGGDSPASGP